MTDTTEVLRQVHAKLISEPSRWDVIGWLEAEIAARSTPAAADGEPVRAALTEFVAALDEKRAANEAMMQGVEEAERSFKATDRIWANLERARAALAAAPSAVASPSECDSLTGQEGEGA